MISFFIRQFLQIKEKALSLYQVFLVVNLVLVFKPWVMRISQGFFVSLCIETYKIDDSKLRS